MIGIIVASVSITLVIVWGIREIIRENKKYKEDIKRIRKAKPLTGAAKEVFIGTYLAR